MREMMQQTPIGVFLMMLAFPLAMAGVLAFAAHRARRTAAVVASAKPEPIGMASDGYRRFEGKADTVAGEALRAPLTGMPCVWYDAQLEQWTYSAAMKRSAWESIRSITSSAPLLLRDGTGVCLVDTWIGEITPTDKSRWTGALPEPVDRLPPRLGSTQSFSEGLEISGGPNSKYRYTESRIYAGDALLVVGQFTNGRFAPADDEEEEDDEIADDVAGDDDGEASPADDPWQAYDQERSETLRQRGADVTKAWVLHGGQHQPLIVANATAATHVAMNEMGAQAAIYVALVPLGIAALMLLARFG